MSWEAKPLFPRRSYFADEVRIVSKPKPGWKSVQIYATTTMMSNIWIKWWCYGIDLVGEGAWMPGNRH